MLLRYSSRLLVLLLTLQLLLCYRCSLAKKQPQCLNTHCERITKTDEDGIILYYVERSDPNATHPSCTRYAWSTVGYPTLFISHENSSCQCKYDLNSSEYTSAQSPGSVNITGTDSQFSLAIVFTRLIEFVVNSKSAHSYTVFNVTENCNDSNSRSEVDLNSNTLKWNLTSNNSTLNASMKADNDSQFVFSINTLFPSIVGFDRQDFFPKPQISENATLVELIFQNFQFNLTNPKDEDSKNASRLALEMFIVHGSRVKNGTNKLHQYIDDEFTPSIFSSWTYDVSGRDKDRSDLGGYLHWKPISYEDASRKSTLSQQIHVLSAGNDSSCEVSKLPLGLATALFGDYVEYAKVSNVTRWFVVFGTDGDDANLNPKYSTWTLVVGYGHVPNDTLSPVVIITIIVGLGIPGLLVIAGGVYVFIKKKPWQSLLAKAQGRNSYQTLQ